MESTWGPTSISNKPDEYSSSEEREARSVALEKAYVHDVYQQIACHFTESRYRTWPRVNQFLLDLEPGSVVCDVGCGDGKYLGFNPHIYKIGLDRCSNLTRVARDKKHEVLVCDNLALPFRDECFDAVLSVAVIHHFATTERRVAALKELARVLRIGGRLMVSVWALEQRHRKFESQDVLVPWTCPVTSSSDDNKTSSIERDLNSTTTTTSDDEITHYHAYTQTSDSDSFMSFSAGYRKRGRVRHCGRFIDPTYPSSSSSDLSSPNESCYSFVRKALQKLAGSRRRRPWFFQGLDISQQERIGGGGGGGGGLDEDDDDEMNDMDLGNHGLMPIELRQLESADFAELLQLQQDVGRKNKHGAGMLFSNMLYPMRRRTLDTTAGTNGDYGIPGMQATQTKSKSLSDLFGLIPAGMLKSAWRSSEERARQQNLQAARSQSSLSDIMSPVEEVEFPDYVRHRAVQTDSLESLDATSVSYPGDTSSSPCKLAASDSSGQFKSDSSLEAEKKRSTRPTLVKQKHSISTSPQNVSHSGSLSGGEGGSAGGNRNSLQSVPTIEMTEDTDDGKEVQDQGLSLLTAVAPVPASEESSKNEPIPWGEIKQSVKNLPDFKTSGTGGDGNNSLRVPASVPQGRSGSGSSIYKQTSLNEELIFSERLKEKERLKQNIQKQCSLNEDLMYKQRENNNTRWDQMKEAFLNSPNVKCLQLIKNGLSSRFRSAAAEAAAPPPGDGAATTSLSGAPPTPGPSSAASSFRHPYQASTSLKNGIVRMLQTWNKGEDTIGGGNNGAGTASFLNSRRGSKEGVPPGRRGLFPPFFLRRSSAGSLGANKMNQMDEQSLSPPPYLMRRPSDNELTDSLNGNGNKLLPGVRHVRKLSREEGSDSSKDSSFQSDTSVDSEDSFASVIYIPKNTSLDNPHGDAYCFNSETRANSTDSDRSPKSPASRLSSPPSYPGPKSPSPLAQELYNRRKSPEVSPTRFNTSTSSPSYSSSGVSSTITNATISSHLETTKFVFDETTTNTFTTTTTTTHFLPPTEVRTGPIFLDENSYSNSNSSCILPTILPVVTEEERVLETIPESPNSANDEALAEAASNITSHHGGSASSQSPRNSSNSSPIHSRKSRVERIEVLRKPGNLPADAKSGITRQLVRRSFPKSLAVELFNPETDDADTSESSSSSPESVGSVVSVLTEEQASTTADSREKAKETKETETQKTDTPILAKRPEERAQLTSTTTTTTAKEQLRRLSSAGLLEAAANMVSSFENLVSHSSPKSRRKLNLAGTSEWLSSLPSDLSGGGGADTSAAAGGPLRRQSSERRSTPGEKMMLGEGKKHQSSKGADTKWPASMTDDSPPQSAKHVLHDEVHHQRSSSPSATATFGAGGGGTQPAPPSSTGPVDLVGKLLEDLEEKDSLYDSMENLTSNPSGDSSVRMSSTCSCSIRGGDSFDSWTSAKSSLTNSSSTHNNITKLPPASLLQLQSRKASLPFGSGSFGHAQPSSSSSGGQQGPRPGSSRRRSQTGGSRASHHVTGGGDEDSTALTYHRYYHVFREGELDRLIENYVQNLHIISSYYDHANWCIVAEKVQVWTI